MPTLPRRTARPLVRSLLTTAPLVWLSIALPSRAEPLATSTSPASSPASLHLAVQQGESEGVVALDVSGNGEVLVTVNERGAAVVWDVRMSLMLRAFSVGQARSVWVSRDGRVAVVASKTGALVTWDVASGARLAELGAAVDGWQGFALHPEQEVGLVADAKGAVREVALRSGQSVHVVRPSGARVRALGYEGGGLALVASEGSVEVRETRTGRVVRRFAKTADAVAASNGAKSVAVGIGDRVEVLGERPATVKLARIGTAKEPAQVRALSYDPARSAFGIAAVAGDPSGQGESPATAFYQLAPGESGARGVHVWDPGSATGHRLETAQALHGGRYVVVGKVDGGSWVRAYGSASFALEPGDYDKHVADAMVFASPSVLVVHTSQAAGRVVTPWLWRWDLATLSAEATLAYDSVGALTVTRAGRVAVSAKQREATGLTLLPGALYDKPLAAVAQSLDGKVAAVVPSEEGPDGQEAPPRTLALVDVGAHKTKWSVPLGDGKASPLLVAPDGSFVARGGGAGGDVVVHEGATGAVRLRIPGRGVLNALTGSADGARLATAIGGTARVFESATGAVVSEWSVSQAAVTALAFEPSGRRLFVGTAEGKVLALEPGAKVPPSEVFAHQAGVLALAASPDGRLLASSSNDRTVRLLRLDGASVRPLMSLVGSTSTRTETASGDPSVEWVAFDPRGRFEASRNGEELAAAVQGLRGYRLEQLALSLNRPDRLVDALGLAPAEYVTRLAARRTRRLARLGVSSEVDLETAFGDAPTARLVRVEPVDPSGKTVDVTVELDARGGELGSYQLWVDGVPLLGLGGKRVSGKSREVKERVELASSDKLLEVSARSQRGIESLRDARPVTYRAPAETARGTLRFVGFGVSRYEDARLDLRFAHKDALDLAHALAAGRERWRSVEVTTFTDAEVTVDRIREAKKLVAEARPDDAVVLFVAGHGTWSRDATPEYFYVTHDTDVRRLRETAAKFELFEELLAASPARRKLLLLDTCESGERDGEAETSPSLTALDAGAKGVRSLRPRSARALRLDVGGLGAGARPAPPSVDWRRYSENDLVRRTGAVVVSSSRGAELSYELDEAENGAFTEALLRATTTADADRNGDGKLDLAELRAFVSRVVPELTQGRQHPAIDRENRGVELAFGVVPGLVLPKVPFAAPRDERDAPRGAPTASEPARVGVGARGNDRLSSRGCACELGGRYRDLGSGVSGAFGALALAGVLAFRRRMALTGSAVSNANANADANGGQDLS